MLSLIAGFIASKKLAKLKVTKLAKPLPEIGTINNVLKFIEPRLFVEHFEALEGASFKKVITYYHDEKAKILFDDVT